MSFVEQVRAALEASGSRRALPWWPSGHTFAVVLTHDVEGPFGLSHLQDVLALERARGFRSSVSFVGDTYTVPDSLLQELRAGRLRDSPARLATRRATLRVACSVRRAAAQDESAAAAVGGGRVQIADDASQSVVDAGPRGGVGLVLLRHRPVRADARRGDEHLALRDGTIRGTALHAAARPHPHRDAGRDEPADLGGEARLHRRLTRAWRS